MPERELHAPAFAILVGLLAAALAAAADRPPKRSAYGYVVLPFVFSPPHRDLGWLGEAFALSVADRLELLGFAVASRRERVDAAEEAGVSSPSPLTLASRLMLARSVRSARAVTGSLAFEPADSGGPIAGHLTVTTIVIEVESGHVARRRTISGTMNELFSMMDEVALETAWHDPAPPGPEARKVLKEISNPPLPSFETVMRAVAERDAERQATLLEAASPAANDHPLLARRLAECLIETGRVEEGMEWLTALDPSRQPDPWRLHLERAEIRLARGEIEAASAEAGRSVAARDTAAGHMMLARIAMAQGRREVAGLEVRLAAALDPDHPALRSLIESIASEEPGGDPNAP